MYIKPQLGVDLRIRMQGINNNFHINKVIPRNTWIDLGAQAFKKPNYIHHKLLL